MGGPEELRKASMNEWTETVLEHDPILGDTGYISFQDDHQAAWGIRRQPASDRLSDSRSGNEHCLVVGDRRECLLTNRSRDSQLHRFPTPLPVAPSPDPP
jgi:hypothetical protein